MFEVEDHATARLVRWKRGDDNTFDLDSVQALNQLLEEWSADEGVRALVMTSGLEHRFHLGMDLQWASQATSDERHLFFCQAHKLLYQTYLFPKPIIGCLNGHTFGLGALWSCAFDMRLMRNDRGWICFPGVDVGVAFPPAMISLVQDTVSPAACRRLLLTGARLDAQQALEIGLIDSAHPPEALLEASLSLAAALSQKDATVYASIKRTMRYPVGQELALAAQDEKQPKAEREQASLPKGGDDFHTQHD